MNIYPIHGPNVYYCRPNRLTASGITCSLDGKARIVRNNRPVARVAAQLTQAVEQLCGKQASFGVGCALLAGSIRPARLEAESTYYIV